MFPVKMNNQNYYVANCPFNYNIKITLFLTKVRNLTKFIFICLPEFKCTLLQENILLKLKQNYQSLARICADF